IGVGEADEKLALASGRYRVARLVGDHRLEAALRPAEGARADAARLLVVGEDPAGLGHAPNLDERYAEAFLEGRVERRVDAGADGEFEPVAALFRLRLLLHQHRKSAATGSNS